MTGTMKPSSRSAAKLWEKIEEVQQKTGPV
jgi:hypothetical protein